MSRSLALGLGLVLATGCHASQQPTGTVRNEGGDPPALHADGSLDGPFARLLDAPALADLVSDETPVEMTVLGSASGTISVALREVRDTPSAATCVVTLETPEGFFVGHGFLCAASRSDEVVFTDEVAVAIDADVATVRFRISYQRDGGKPDVQRHEVTCNLTSTLSCTAPPAIGGYE